MSSSNLLEPLMSVIETIKQRIDLYGASLRENETRTRVALIDPILQALGWDVSDPRLVKLENPTEPGRVDYALLSGGEERPRALVEAKRLGTNLQSHRTQMVNYAVTQGIGYAGLTDGNVWELYDVFKPTVLSEKKLLDIVIADSPSHESALKLLRLWRPNVASDAPPVEAVLPIVGLPDDAGPEADPPQPLPEPIDGEAPTTPADGRWMPLSEFDPPAGAPAPSRIRFPENDLRPTTSWQSVLVATAEWLYDTGRLTRDRVPLRTKKLRRILINTEPIKSNNKQMAVARQIRSSGLYFEGHASALQIRQLSCTMLELLGVDPATVHVLPAE